MIARVGDFCGAAVLLLTVAHTATAQTSRVEVSGAYDVTRAADQTLPIGWSADVAVALNGSWSVVGGVSGAYRVDEDDDFGTDVTLSIHGFGAGARWSRRAAAKVVPFLQVLAGAARIGAHTTILDREVGESLTKFMLQPGGGVTVHLNETLGLLGRVDYGRVFLGEEKGGESGANQWRAVIGVRIGL